MKTLVPPGFPRDVRGNRRGSHHLAKGFTGHENTDQSGLIYMQARMYIPWFGRFASPDAPGNDQHFEFTQSWNTYSYVQNQPTMRIDPTGMAGGMIDWNGLWNKVKSVFGGSSKPAASGPLPAGQSGKASKSTLVSTNPRVNAVVENVAKSMGSTVTYTDANGRALGPGAGDRSASGQNDKSDHKKKNAQDLHVDGKTDVQVVEHIQNNPGLVPPNTQVILHGDFSKPDGTHAGPPHVHIGISDTNRYGGDVLITREGIKSGSGPGGPGNYKDAVHVKQQETNTQ